jgi:N-acetylmuramoyl-L-alanine amidase
MSLLALFVAAGCTVVPPAPPVAALSSEAAWIPLNQWAKANGLPPAERLALPPVVMTITNGFKWNDLNLKARTSLVPLPTFLLRASNDVLTVQPETRWAYWNEVQIHLGFAPKLVQGGLLLHALDYQKTIEPLLRLAPLPGTNRVVVLDPATGESPPAQEEFTQDWAQRLAPLLASNGWQVVITRTNSLNRSLQDRAAIADIYQPDLFLSLDFNFDALNPALAGVETLCVTPTDMPSNGSMIWSENNWQVFPNNAFDAANWQYAFRLHRALSRVADVEDHGLRRARSVSLLGDRKCPAVRVSGGYLSNMHDAALIANPLFRQQLAEAVAAALP